MIVYPNAKINIGLNVLEKQADGYHKLSSVFYPVNELCDILEIIPATEFSFSSSGIAISGNSNICVKAFELLKADFEIANVIMHLHKQIPIGAGLGGGSADGAFTLKALNKLFIETYWSYPKAIFHPHNEFVVMKKDESTKTNKDK